MNKKFCVIGDPTNKPRFSSNIITSSLNKAAQELDFFDPEGIQIKYDGVCNTHGDKVDAFICSYELYFPDIIVNNAGGKPILGVSLHNWSNIIESNHKGKSGHFPLGVDSSYYELTPKTKMMDKFVYGVYSESLIRGDIENVAYTFGRFFRGQKDVVLIIKDRNGTERFKDYINGLSNFFNVDIQYINEHWSEKEQIIDFASKIDVYINTNRCSTFNMPVLEMMSMGKPSIITPYSGPADFCLNGFNCLCPEFEIIEAEISFFQAQSLGCRNFFFDTGYKKKPVWASTDSSSLFEKMVLLKDNHQLRETLSRNARKTAEDMTWKRSANKLSLLINDLL